MIRKIIKIDEEKCNGCGLCAEACHEGAIEMVNNKAKLMREDYCDGLGACLPVCPTGAISFEEREAATFLNPDLQTDTILANQHTLSPSGCSGNQVKIVENQAHRSAVQVYLEPGNYLMQWPVQIKLVPINAPYFDNASILVAADCTAYAYGNFHHRFMKNQVTLIGCPKLDEGDYSQKFTQIFIHNNIKSITIVRMEVPCCGGIVTAIKKALNDSGKQIPLKVITVSINGQVIEG